MPEIVQFPTNRAAPRDWLLEDLFELKDVIEALPNNNEAMELVAELIEGRTLELRT